MYASQNGHLEIVKALLAAGADLHVTNNVSSRYSSNIDLGDANPNVLPKLCYFPNQDGQNVLMYSCIRGHNLVVSALLAAGADLNITNNVSIDIHITSREQFNCYLHVCKCVLFEIVTLYLLSGKIYCTYAC